MMNHPLFLTVVANTADGVNLHTFLQQAVDHYPQLVAFSFTLKLPSREILNEYRSLFLRFHTEVWQRVDEYSRQRQQVRFHSPPTILRWLWDETSAPRCNMILLMNLNTLEGVRNRRLIDSALQEMNTIISDAWSAAADSGNRITNMASAIISRADRDLFPISFNSLRERVDRLAFSVITARRGAIFS
jgi:hypothetical protein